MRAFAPAKVNLTLAVLGRRGDGYHALDSLVAFADAGDWLALEPADATTLRVVGPFAGPAGDGADNLVLRAADEVTRRGLGATGFAFTLQKALPVAAGLGGGSSDAAAALRLLARVNRADIDAPAWRAAAEALGSDVPMCLDPRPRWIGGRGEELGPPLAMPRLPAVLVNPGVACPTGPVFAALEHEIGKLAPAERLALPPADAPVVMWIAAIARGRNDLEPPARARVPVIATVAAALERTAHCGLARMSGSGATVFGLYPDRAAADAAAASLSAAHPDWWVRATMLGAGGSDDHASAG